MCAIGTALFDTPKNVYFPTSKHILHPHYMNISFGSSIMFVPQCLALLAAAEIHPSWLNKRINYLNNETARSRDPEANLQVLLSS